MISQIANSVSMLSGSSGQSPPVADIKPQKLAAPVELPQKAGMATDGVVDIGTVKKAAEQINKVIQQQFDRGIQFTVDEATGVNVVKVIDTQTNDVIRQMPTPEMLAIASALDKLQGILIRVKA